MQNALFLIHLRRLLKYCLCQTAKRFSRAVCLRMKEHSQLYGLTNRRIGHEKDCKMPRHTPLYQLFVCSGIFWKPHKKTQAPQTRLSFKQDTLLVGLRFSITLYVKAWIIHPRPLPHVPQSVSAGVRSARVRSLQILS